ncbi:hypothetical protein [Paractinoplanes durhamensis]|uniref:Uncharacterized protein n=1 Tax=Paractinoplanes durhamensis TaxID=113563 RepID=A0ABQ3YMY7_9ACTN|nr:hypothetical protein [Actinoplanes durhamensis]GID98935.1 hypothetical protein Adu01nite_02860 [Actinoplanes durhamensis]
MPPIPEQNCDDLSLARWEVATLTGRLRSVEAERDAAVRERDRTQDLVGELRRSRSYRVGRVLVGLSRDPMRTARRLLRRRYTAIPARAKTVPGPVPARVYVAVGLDRDASHGLIRALRQRILVDGDHLPVVVTDQPALRGLQVPGVILEYLPDPVTWSQHESGEWEGLLAGRVAQLCRDHRAARAVVVDPRDPPTLAKLLEPSRY